MSARTLSYSLALACSLASGCSKSEPKQAPEAELDAPDEAHEEEPRSLEDELQRAHEDEEYEPTPLDLPLTSDFAKAASKRVTAESYRDELARIERELAYVSKRSPGR